METWGIYLIVIIVICLMWKVGASTEKRGGATPKSTINTREAEEEFDDDKWRPSVTGVTYKNPDGTDRQKIIAGLTAGKPLQLIRDPDNKHGEGTAIGVFTQLREQIGWIPSELAGGTRQYAYFMDRGGKLTAKVYRVIGGGRGKNYGCLIDIEKGDIPYLVKESEAKDLIDKAKPLENTNPEEAIRLYEKAMQTLGEADRIFQETLYYKGSRSWLRKTKYPIIRLTLVLEKNKKYEKCLEVIEQYERPQLNKRPISKSELENLRKRKARIMKMLS